MNINQPGFECIHCGTWIPVHSYMGTSHRNHCPFCLWSLHVDKDIPGDRLSTCIGPMEPIGLTYKHEGVDKYGKQKQGELMIVHRCTICGKININRIAADDDEKEILEILHRTALTDAVQTELQRMNIDVLGLLAESNVKQQLFGKLHS